MTSRTDSWPSEYNRPFCLALLPMGFTQPIRSPESLVRSYRTVSPLPLKDRERSSDWRFTFCCTFPILADGGSYPPSCPVEPGLSSESKDPANRTRWWVTPTVREDRESATESKPPNGGVMAWPSHCVVVRVKRCGKSAPAVRVTVWLGKPHQEQGQAEGKAAFVASNRSDSLTFG